MLFLGSCPGPHVFLVVFFFLGGGGVGDLCWVIVLDLSCWLGFEGLAVLVVLLFWAPVFPMFFVCSVACCFCLIVVPGLLPWTSCFSCCFRGGGWGLLLGYCVGSLLLVGFEGLAVLVVLLFWAPVFPMCFLFCFLLFLSNCCSWALVLDLMFFSCCVFWGGGGGGFGDLCWAIVFWISLVGCFLGVSLLVVILFWAPVFPMLLFFGVSCCFCLIVVPGFLSWTPCFSCWFWRGFWGLMLGYCFFGSLLLVGFGGLALLVVLLFWAPVFPMFFVCVSLVVSVLLLFLGSCPGPHVFSCWFLFFFFFWGGGGVGDLCWAIVLDLSYWLVLGVSLFLFSSCSGQVFCCVFLVVSVLLLFLGSCPGPLFFLLGFGGVLGTYVGLLFWSSLVGWFLGVSLLDVLLFWAPVFPMFFLCVSCCTCLIVVPGLCLCGCL